MALRTPSPVFNSVNFIQDGEKGKQSVLNRPLYTLDDKCEYLLSTLTVLETNASCLADKLGETFGSNCVDPSTCEPCWSSPSIFGGNDTYKDAIGKLESKLKTVDSSLTVSALAKLQSIALVEGISYSGITAPFSGTSYIDGETHRDALSILDDVAAIAASDIVALQSSAGSMATLLSTHTSQIASLQTTVTTQSTAISSINVVDSIQTANISILTSLLSSVSTLQSSANSTLSAVSTLASSIASNCC